MGDRSSLDEHSIAAKALEIIDGDGLRAFNLRKLAEALGVTPHALYYHYSDKESILDGVVQLILAEVEPPSPGLDWRVTLEEIMRSFRKTGLRHRNAIPLLMSYPPRTPNASVFIEAGMRATTAAGFPDEAVKASYRALAAYSFGTLALEVGAGNSSVATAATNRGYFSGHVAVEPSPKTLDAVSAGNHFPNMLRVGPLLADKDDDDQFELGLQFFLYGFEAFYFGKSGSAGFSVARATGR